MATLFLSLKRPNNQIYLPMNMAHSVTSTSMSNLALGKILGFFPFPIFPSRCPLSLSTPGNSSVLTLPLLASLTFRESVLQMSSEIENDAETYQHGRPHQCPECGQIFTLLSDTQKHLETVHSVYQRENEKSQGHDPDTESSFNDWSKPELLQSIHKSIDWLHRLSNMVRKASFNHQNKRADHFMLRDENGEKSEELTRSMLDGLTQLYQFYIRTHAAGVEEKLAQRLVQTMIIRHRRILYRRSRRRVWNLEQIKYTPRKAEQKSHHLNFSLSAPETIPPSHGHSSGLPQPTPRTKLAPSQVTATTVDISILRKAFAQSEVSKATSDSLFLSDRVLVPPRPAAAKMGMDFICEYCGLLLQARQASNTAAWA